MSEDLNGAAGANDGKLELDESKLPNFSEIDPNNVTPEKVTELVKAAQTLHGLTKHYRTKAVDPATGKPYSQLLADAVKKPEQTPPAANPGAGDDELRKDVEGLKLSEEKRQFGHSHSLTPEETDNLFAFAKGMGLNPAQAKDHPFFKGGIESLRQQVRQDGATPGSSRRAPVVEGKPFNEMNIDEKRKNFPEVVKQLNKK